MTGNGANAVEIQGLNKWFKAFHVLKDTSLVSIIGFFDLLGIAQVGTSDANWATPNTALTGYAFVGMVYWAMCFSMSRYAKHLEGVLGAGEKR